MTAEARAQNIKVLIFDVDGVLTDGQIFVIPGPDGHGIESKGFAAHDGLGISLGRLGGLKGGKARAAKLSKKRLSAIGKKGAAGRWGKKRDDKKRDDKKRS